MPTKKKSCERVRKGIAGPAPDHILEAIRAEYWLPARTPHGSRRDAGKDTAQPAGKPKTQVKP